MKFYYSLFSDVSLPPSLDSVAPRTMAPRSMAPSREVRTKRKISHDVNFILGCPVTQGLRDREALAFPTATRHC